MTTKRSRDNRVSHLYGKKKHGGYVSIPVENLENVYAFKYMFRKKIRSGFTCTYCGISMRIDGRNMPKSYTVDHIHPRSNGGSNDPKNLCLCCYSCNTLKANLLPEEIPTRFEMFGWR